MKNQSLKSKIDTKICRSQRKVFLRSDFQKLSDYDQVGRALRELISEGKLIKIGYGLYAKARPSRLTGKTMLAADGGFNQVAKEALKRLGVKWQYSEAVIAYNNGSTTQIPVNAPLIVPGRFNRKIGTDNFKLKLAKS